MLSLLRRRGLVLRCQRRIPMIARRASSSRPPSDEEDWEFVAPEKTMWNDWDASKSSSRKRQPLEREIGSGPLSAPEVEKMLMEDGATEVESVALPLDVPLGDAMIFATARSETHLAALADRVIATMKRRGLGDRGSVDGDGRGDGWIVVDVGNLMIHLMLQSARDRLQLETYWDPIFKGQRRIYNSDLDIMVPENVIIQPPPSTAKERRRRLRRARRSGDEVLVDAPYWGYTK